MDKIKKWIEMYIPVESCTLRCDYCYITQHRLFAKGLPNLPHSPEEVRKALSVKRLGGICFINMCGGGETLLPPKVIDYVKALLEEGHYVSLVTNGTVTSALRKIAAFDSKLLKHLFLKFSYHYVELKNRNLLDKFFDNIRMVRDAGASFTLEETANDNTIPYIDEMKKVAIDNVGALPHISIARDETDPNSLPILTKLSKNDFYKTWSTFNSNLFKYKFSIFGIKRHEFCYAGLWSLSVNIGTGAVSQCYKTYYNINLFDNLDKPLEMRPIGCHCPECHCYNGHSFISWGDIPSLKAPTYAELRNRVCKDGSEWLKPEMKSFMASKLWETNKQYSSVEKIRLDLWYCLLSAKSFLKRFFKR